MRASLPRAALGFCLLPWLAACGPEKPAEEWRPRVEVQTVAVAAQAGEATLSGDVRARVQTSQSFRIGGKIIERNVDVGDQVRTGQVLARLDPQDQINNVKAAEASEMAERARLKQAKDDLWRQQQLLPKGYTSRSEYDSAVAAERAARNSLASAQAQLANAKEQLGYTELAAEADGVITRRDAEVGQVVQATAPVFGLAVDGDRDAVFNIYQDLLGAPEDQPIIVRLLDDPQVTARGRVREVTPAVSSDTGTVQVKVALIDPPAAMPLGAIVTATAQLQPNPGVVLPWSALTKKGHEPAVWTVGEGDVVSLRSVTVARYETGHVVLAAGVADGDRVVVAGGQLIHPQQQVEIARERGETRP